jgi:hypothetical protein
MWLLTERLYEAQTQPWAAAGTKQQCAASSAAWWLGWVRAVPGSVAVVCCLFHVDLQMGIVGLPNVGKSTLFNVLTKLSIPAENFPFCTIEPNQVCSEGQLNEVQGCAAVVLRPHQLY